MIISRPYEVVEAEMARHGILPTVAPVKPYTELADTCVGRTEVWKGVDTCVSVCVRACVRGAAAGGMCARV